MRPEFPTAIHHREDLARFADGLLLAVRPHNSPGHARITLPGTPGGYGTAIDGLEGFARTFLLAGFRLAGEQGADRFGYAQWYTRGLVAGTDPTSPERWVRPSEHGQAKVEAASLALVLDLTRSWIWDRLTSSEQERIVGYLAEVVGDETYPRNNWLWFRIVVETFLRSVGGPHRLSDIRADLERHEEFYQCQGWYRDGDERAYDHYVGWAMHLYPTLWARMRGAHDLAAGRAAVDRERLDRYLQDAVHLVGGDGAPLFQGRSLVYRFAAAAPFWIGAMAEVPSFSPGLLGQMAMRTVDYFVQHGVPNGRGLLDLGWFGPWRRLAQRYSGTGSPYWASKGLLGLALPADHPVWSARPAEPGAEPAAEAESPEPSAEPGIHAPGENQAPHGGSALRVITAPGWLAGSGTDGSIARITNHGTDHACPGARSGDSPLYARLAYSTATAPLLSQSAWDRPIDQSVVLLDGQGRRSHRSGMQTILPPALHPESPTQQEPAGAAVGIAASRSDVHWVAADPDEPDHGSGRSGTSTPAGTMTVVSVVRGDWEVRVVHVQNLADTARAVQAGGWVLSDDAGITVATGPQRVDTASRTLSACVAGLHGWDEAAVEHHDDATPLGAHSAVGVLQAPARPGYFALALGLGQHLGPAPSIELNPPTLYITWPDQTGSTVHLPGQELP